MSVAAADAFMSIFGMKRVKPQVCKVCTAEFTPQRMGQKTCADPVCRKEWKRQIEREKAEREERRRHKEKLYANRKLEWHLSRTQDAVNAYVRARDEGKHCITCETVLIKTGRVGGDYDAGHCRTVTAAGHLRYDYANIHGQCKHCNNWGAGKQGDYWPALEARIGREECERLRNDNKPHKWTRDELEVIYQDAKCKLKELRDARP